MKPFYKYGLICSLEVHNRRQSSKQVDHPCNDSHMVQSEGECLQADCMPPRYHHGIGAKCVFEALSASCVGEWLKTTKKDSYGSVQVLL